MKVENYGSFLVKLCVKITAHKTIGHEVVMFSSTS